MSHLSDDLIYTLAVKVANESDLTLEEEKALMHVTQCDECYHLLCCTMAMQDVIQNIGALAVNAPPVEATYPVRETIRAVLRLVVGAVNSVLDQVAAGANEWSFRSTPTLLVGARGSGRRSSVKKLTDQQNSKNFAAYDTDKQLLMIQLDASEYSNPPTAFLTLSDGTETEIHFERRGDIFWAEVTGLDEGNYELTLEK